MKNSWKTHAGYLLMLVALTIPFVTFGRMVWQNIHQVQSYQTYRKGLDKRVTRTIQTASKAYNKQLNSNNNIVDPFLAEGNDVDYGILEETDDIYGYVSIPSLEVMEPVYLGASLHHLGMGLAHVDGTSLPLDGMGVRSVIAGHRAEPSHVFFRHLDKLVPGDKLYFDNGSEILTYQMVSSEVILPSEWDKLLPVKDKNWITLITCDPIPIYNKRLLVNFERIEETTTESTTVEKVAFTKKSQVTSKVSGSQWLYKGICGIAVIGWFLVLRNYLKRLKN